MAQLWTHGVAGWQIVPLSGSGYELFGAGTLRPDANGKRWILFAHGGTEAGRAALRVNGDPLLLGVRVFRDRDMLHLADGRQVFFSTERLVAVEPYRPRADAGARQINCRRCQQPIAEAQPAVTCPGCGAVYHQDDACACWTYAPTCAECPQVTDLEAGYSWTPEEM